jgi:universal stress protein A
LVTAQEPASIKQVVAAVDLSDAATPTARAAARFAEMFGAALHLLHVVEPLPIIPDTPLRFNDDEVYDHSLEHLERYVWNKIDYPGVTTSMRRGTAADTIAQEVAEREAQLVVVGSHGKGWVDRILIGSITERVLSALPCTILVVPVAGPTSPRRPRTKRSKQAP